LWAGTKMRSGKYQVSWGKRALLRCDTMEERNKRTEGKGVVFLKGSSNTTLSGGCPAYCEREGAGKRFSGGLVFPGGGISESTKKLRR